MWILDNSGIVTCVWVKVKACANRSAFLFGPPLKLYEVTVQHFCQAIQIVTRGSHGTSVRTCQPGATHGNPWEVLQKRSPIRAVKKSPFFKGGIHCKGTLWCHQTWRKIIEHPLQIGAMCHQRSSRLGVQDQSMVPQGNQTIPQLLSGCHRDNLFKHI